MEWISRFVRGDFKTFSDIAIPFRNFSSSISSSSGLILASGEYKPLFHAIRSRLDRLDGTGIQHLVAQVVLVRSDGTIPAADSLVLADHDVLGDLVEKTEIVGHDDNTTLVSVDGISQRVNSGDIETVGRLVQQDHVGGLDGQQSENDTTLLTLGQGTHDGGLGLTAETVAAQLLAPVLVVLGLLGELVTDELQRRLGQVKLLSRVLAVHAELQVSVAGDTTTDGAQLAGHETEQGGLADTVGTDQGSTGVHVNTEVKVLVQGIVPVTRVREADIVEGQDGRGQLLDLSEAESEDAVGDDRLDETIGLHLVKNLLAGLGLTHQVGVGTSGSNELLDVLDFLLLLGVGLHLVGLLLTASLVVRIVVTTVVEKLLATHVQHVGADTVQEIHGVGDQNQGTLPLLHVLLQPHTGLQVQVSSGVIQKKQRRLDEQGLGEGNTHTPATGHILGLLVNGGLVEAQTSQDQGSTSVEGGGIHLVHALYRSLV